MKTKTAAAAAAFLTLVLVSCGEGGDPSPEGVQDQPDTAATNAIDVTMADYSFDVQGDAKSGPLVVDFTNSGQELHHGIIGKLGEGKTLADVRQFLESGEQGPPPPWFDDSPPDMTLISPGEKAGVVIDAHEGTYVMLCFMPDPQGKPHVASGMFQTFDVAADGDVADIDPDASLSMTEDGVEAPELSPGASIVEVTNDAGEAGEVFVVRLAEGKTLDDVEPWFEGGQQGSPPATFFGGTHEFPPGESVLLSLDVEAGDYSIVATFGEGRKVEDVPTEFTVSG